MVLIAFVVAMVSAAAASAGDSSHFRWAQNEDGITLPDGFRRVVVADDLGTVRHIDVRDNGDVYAALRQVHQGGGIVALRDTNGDSVADVQKRFGEDGGTGIGFYNGDLYFATPLKVIRYPMEDGKLLPTGPPELVVGGFPEQGQHADKTFAFDDKGHMFVNVGGPSNACQEETRTPHVDGMEPCPQLERHAGIWRFDATELNQTQQEDGVHFATGIRHTVTMMWNGCVDELYIMQHGRDQLHSLWPEKFTVEQNAKLPAEELLQVQKGDNFGWPYCYYDPFKEKRVLAPEYGGNGEEVGRCDQYDRPVMAFPAHWAPNGLMFYNGSQFPDRYFGGAFIAFHGSWNRAPLEQQGYKVVFVPFEDGKPAGDFEVFANNFAGEGPIESTGDARWRPMGLAQGPDGSLYMSETDDGRIWRVLYRPEKR
ncbi:MAG: PQQ-dependent sugar dehydrogenase [Planctomycetota bacterium]